MKTFQCKKCEEHFLVDDKNYEKLYSHHKYHSWTHTYTGNSSCAIRWKENGYTRNVSELVMGPPLQGKIWDHVDDNVHNLQESNLRPATRWENVMYSYAKKGRKPTTKFHKKILELFK